MILRLVYFVLVVLTVFFILQTSSLRANLLQKNFNCSNITSVGNFDNSKFTGKWHYLRLHSEVPHKTDLNCLQLKTDYSESVFSIDITLPDPDSPGHVLHTVMSGAVDDINNNARWNLYSKSPFATSEWIIVSMSPDYQTLMYFICGDFPDGKSTLGEVGIISRKPSISDFDLWYFSLNLNRLNFNVTFKPVTQNNCPQSD